MAVARVPVSFLQLLLISATLHLLQLQPPLVAGHGRGRDGSSNYRGRLPTRSLSRHAVNQNTNDVNVKYSAVPEQLHLFYPGGRDPSRMAVSFAILLPSRGLTNASAPLARVEYDVISNNSSDSSSKVVGARVWTYDYKLGDFEGWVGEAIMIGLLPGEKFTYRVSAQDFNTKIWSSSSQYTSRAMPDIASKQPFSVLSIADMGLEDSGWTAEGLAKDAATGDFAMLLHSGDISYADDRTHVGIPNAYVWNDYMNEMEPVGARVPWNTAVGNHETQWNFQVYENRFAMHLGAEGSGSTSPLWYSFDIGALAHFVSWSTETPFYPGSEQYKWLEKDLRAARARGTPWIIMYNHRALYCTGLIDTYINDRCGPLPKGQAGQYRQWLEPLIHEMGVAMLITGHNHQYERSLPVYDMKVNHQNGTVYVVNGGAGDIEQLDPTFLFPGPEWRGACRPLEFGYGRLHISETELTWEFVDVNFGERRVSDTFTIRSNNL